MKLAISRWILLVCTTTVYFGVCSGQVISFGMRKLAASTNQFGLDLMRAMDRSEATMAFCPFCIGSSLAQLLMGAQGPMESALRHALYLWGMQPQEINLAFYDMNNHLGVNLPYGLRHRSSGLFSSNNYLTNETNDNEVIFTNNIYYQRDFGINYNYHILLQRFYKTAVHPLDFVHNGEETRQHINAIVEMQTGNKVKDILPDRQSAATQLLLISAFYFEGTLDINMSSTKRLNNHIYNNKVNNNLIKPMHGYDAFGDESTILESRRSRIRHGINTYLNCTAVEMPFKGGIISLVAIMPHDINGLDLMLTRMSAQMLSDVVSGLEVKRVSLKMPKLSFEKSNRNLSRAFANMGLSDLFKPGYANLYHISDYKWLHVSEVLHKTYIDIKESAFPMHSYNSSSNVKNFNTNFKNQHNSDVTHVEFDKPFVYFIVDNISGLILVMGKVGREPANYRLPV
ncbi:leukocyte elastase inhibitor A-like [Oppia nitens]|uniref:leukocyte elastase inhibitor A-like n=1 Tax=Oppia nitens TaxID=1686743 RepID=UPI0023DADE11|nr:leukocyte elastase inhibitor A-like [Oppia nitens]